MNNKFEPLFKSDSDWHNNACLNFTSDTTGLYISGYKDAADALVIQINETACNQDTLVYPIVFLYRHYLELLLKFIINEGRQLLEDKTGYPTHHKIENLWPAAKGIIRKVWSGNDPEEMELTDHVINEVSVIDPEAICFRYPEDKRGNKSIPNLTHINLRHLGQTINRVGTFLEGVLMGIGGYLLEYKDVQDNVYTRRKKLSIYWYNKASDLRGSAGALWASMDDRRSKDIAEELGLGKGFSMAVATRPVYLMLCGMALELLYKAITIAKGNEPKKSHNLNQLALAAELEIKGKQAGLLDILSESIIWNGRYPVPHKHSDFENLNKLINEHLYDKESLGNLHVSKPNNALSWESFNELWSNAFDVYCQYHS